MQKPHICCLGKKKSENCDRFNRKSSNDKEQIKKNVDY